MPDEKKELLERIATSFPKLDESSKFFVAGYISGIEHAYLDFDGRNTGQTGKEEKEMTSV